ncbi:hypothetical protein BDK51DRAFT_50440 [Blyttiomyces helicus]|uniref:Uncharacterized protein n=1 Tax=Blyttiomyces helicus TaxID=388810 RepID=A0A4P9VVU0_9FUNG|nr:hypothetical protein BDK51DRAFT_50440 [Blyttiomyces helicus]|eukprot:RKO82955.1 hypothetical protein BDK51DRAFT_50440 [Blyttiomyces helicus]
MPDSPPMPPPDVGIPVDSVYAEELWAKMKELLGGWKGEGFPGSQPIGFLKDHLQALEREDYFVCEKSHGRRHLLLLMNTAKGPAAFLLPLRGHEVPRQRPEIPIGYPQIS